MKHVLTLLLITFNLAAFAQLDPGNYHDGYYVDNNNNKVYGLIRYVKGNNARIEYKEDADAKKIKISPSECKEFMLAHKMRFIRVEGSFTVKIGVWKMEIANDFIEVLEEGDISLYKHYSFSGNGDPKHLGTIDYENLVLKKDGKYYGLHPNLKKRRKYLEDEVKGEEKLIDVLCLEKESQIVQGIHQLNSK